MGEQLPGVYRAVSFVCGAGGCGVGYTQRPNWEIAGNLLEDVTYWRNALDGVEEVPPGVVAALQQLHEATAAWCDLLERKEGRADG